MLRAEEKHALSFGLFPAMEEGITFLCEMCREELCREACGFSTINMAL